MSMDVVIGVVLLVAALTVLTVFTAWSRRIINRIAAKRLGSARDIVKDMTNGR